jgi:hypothetical protein
MQEDAVKSRLIPQFSIRWLFGATAIVAVAFTIVGLAVRGSGWAVAVSFGMASLAILVLTYALMFGVVWMFSVVCGRFVVRRSRAGPSPFGSGVGSSNETASPFAPAGDVSTAAAVEAVLVETPEEPPRPDPETG